MRLIIDSHVLIWAVHDPTRLSPPAVAALQDPANNRFLSAATVWEIAIKVGLNKLKLTLPFAQWMKKAIADLKLQLLPITIEYAEMQSSLPNHHGDPFDRMIIAQALKDGGSVVGADTGFDAYGVSRIW